MKKVKTWIYQKFANFIIKQMKKAPNKKVVRLWYDFGTDFNDRCVTQGIYLD